MPNSRALQDEQLAPGLARVEPGLLQRDADPAARRVGLARRRRRRRRARCPTVIDSSVVSIRTVVDLPAPFGPEEAEHLAGLDPQVDAAHGLDVAASAGVVLDEAFGFNSGHGSRG